MLVEVDVCEYGFEALEVVLYGLVYFGLLKRVLVPLDIFLHVCGDLLDVSQVHVCSYKILYIFVVEKEVNQFEEDLLLKLVVVL